MNNAIIQNSIDNLNRQIQQLQSLSDQFKSSTVKQEQSSAPVKVESNPRMDSAVLFSLYQEFLLCDEGKALASSLQKFARFAQSKCNK